MTQYSAEVITPAAPPPDRDQERYDELWRKLGGERRAKLEQDWKIYHASQQYLDSLRMLAAMFPVQSQLKRRLGVNMRPPGGWNLCGYCQGSGDGDLGYCRNCQGDGYVT